MRRKMATLVAVAVVAGVMSISVGAQAHGGPLVDNVYTVVHDRMDWHSANAAARMMAAPGCRTAHLATVTSQAEADIVTSLVASAGDNAWIGGFQGGPTLDENWHWVTGEMMAFTNWAGNEPNDTPFGDYVPGSEQHLEVVFGGQPDWNDAPGFEEKLFVIESEHCH